MSLTTSAPQTLASWRRTPWANLMDPKALERAHAVLWALVQQHGDVFVGKQIDAYYAWTVANPYRVKGRKAHDRAIRTWICREVERLQAQQRPPAYERPAPAAYQGLSWYDCLGCGWRERTTAILYAAHQAGCKLFAARRAGLTAAKMRADLAQRGW